MNDRHEPDPPAMTWPSMPITVELTQRHRQRERPDAWLRGRAWYLPRLDAVVQPLLPADGQWRCLIVAHRQPAESRAGYATIGSDELATAPTTLTVSDEASFVLAWLCTVWQRWYGGTTQLAAQVLANDLRQPGTLALDIDPAALLRLVSVTRLRPPGLRRLLDRFANGRLIRRTGPGPSQGWGIYVLTLPMTAGCSDDARQEALPGKEAP